MAKDRKDPFDESDSLDLQPGKEEGEGFSSVPVYDARRESLVDAPVRDEETDTEEKTENGEEKVLYPGDAEVCSNGSIHAIENHGTSDLKIMAVILWNPNVRKE